MIEEIGSVVELKGKHVAVVLCQKSSFCKNCASMESCQIGADNKSKLVEAHNVIGARVGDQVKLSVSSRSFLQSSFLLYILPLIALVIGAMLGQSVGEKGFGDLDANLMSALFGVFFMVGSFVIIKIGSSRLSQDLYMPRITAVLTAEEAFTRDLKHGH